MNGSGPRRRDVLVAASSGTLLLAGCAESDSTESDSTESDSTESDPTDDPDHAEYGTAYGLEYGYGGE